MPKESLVLGLPVVTSILKYSFPEARMFESESSSDDEARSNITSSQSQEDHQIFAGLSAWFSESVESGWIEDWRSYGGEVTDVEAAQFLFSENCESHDTLRIYQSDQFRKEHVGVIHALFIDECLKKKSVDAVPIGLYYLPPKQVQELLGKNWCFRWQVDEKRPEPKEVDQWQTRPEPKEVNQWQTRPEPKEVDQWRTRPEPEEVHHQWYTQPEPKKVVHQWYRKPEPKTVNHQWYTEGIPPEVMAGAGDADSDRRKRDESEAAESWRLRSIRCEPRQGHVNLKTLPQPDQEDVFKPDTFNSSEETEEKQTRVPHVSELELATGDLMLFDTDNPMFHVAYKKTKSRKTSER